MDENPAENYFCCLADAERSVMRVTGLDLPVTLFLGIPSPIWYAFWLGTAHNEARYIDAFLLLYGLEVVTTTLDGEEVEVVRPRDGYLDYWVSLSLFVLSPSGACLDGCPLSARPAP